MVSIVPLCLLARQLAELLSVHTSMPISKIVPAYKEKFGRDLVITNFGFPKLIKALEALPELIEVSFSPFFKGVQAVFSFRFEELVQLVWLH